LPDNNRRFTRITIEIPADIVLADGTAHHTRNIENLSIGGCLFYTAANIKDGQACTVIINIGSDQSHRIEVAGRIVRTEKNMAAVNFESIDPDSLFLLQNLIRYNAAEPDTIEHEITTRPGIR